MDPVTLIVTALAAGASAGTADALKDDAKDAVTSANAKLRSLVRKRLAGRADAELALERHQAAPAKWESVLAGELTEAGAASDRDLVAAARTLMELIDAGTRSSTYNVTITGSEGIQVGDRNVQVNTWF